MRTFFHFFFISMQGSLDLWNFSEMIDCLIWLGCISWSFTKINSCSSFKRICLKLISLKCNSYACIEKLKIFDLYENPRNSIFEIHQGK